MSSNDCNAMFHERRIAARGAVLRSLAVAVMLVSGGSASGCSDGSGADPDAGAMDTGVDGAVDGGADAGADDGSVDSSTVDAGDVGTEADSGSEDLGSDASSDQGFDQGGADQGPVSCDLLSGAPCEAPLRCTIVRDGANETIQCAPAGTGQEFEGCQTNESGDTCGAGFTCIGRVCMAPCAEFGGVCGANSSCTRYQFGENLEDAVAFCAPTCNPVTQLRDVDGVLCSANGSSTACYVSSAGGGCFIAGDPARTQGVAISGFVSANSCAAGFRPTSYPPSGLECTAYCSPIETHMGQQTGVAGASPHTCPDRGANAPHECRFLHVTNPQFGAIGDQAGTCIDVSRSLYDHDSDPDTARINYPSCTTLPNVDTDSDGVPQHVQFGCGPREVP